MKRPFFNISRSELNQHFETDHLTSDIRGRAIRGGMITFASQGLGFVVNLSSMAILARLLLPESFGLIVMVTSLVGFLELFKDGGLSMATVQQEKITHDQISTLFWLNVGISALLMLLIAAISPLVSSFYGEPRLTLLTIALGAGFVFSGLSIQHQALLRRQMQFGRLATIQIVSQVAGNGIAIVTALYGWHYWALVARALVTPAVYMLGSWIAMPWRPGMPRRGVGTASMLKFGGYLTADGFLIYIARNIDNILIGKFIGPIQTGIYTRSYRLMSLPVTQLRGPASGVVIPMLSRFQNEPSQFRIAVLRASFLLGFILIPLSAVLVLFSREIILVVLGQDWRAAIPVLRWLAPAALLPSMTFAVGWQLTALGKVKRSFQWNLFYVPISIIGFIIGLQWGLIGVAASRTLISFAAFFPFLLFCLHDTPVGWQMLLRNLWKPFASTIVSAIIVWTVSIWLVHALSEIRWLLMGIIFYALLYLSIFAILPDGRNDLKFIIESIKQGLSWKKEASINE